MFGIGSTELVVILIVALLVLGPKNLPKIAQTLGRALGEFRKVSTEFQRTLNTEVAFEEEAEKAKKERTSKEAESPTAKAADAPVIETVAQASSPVTPAPSPATPASSISPISTGAPEAAAKPDSTGDKA